MMRSIAVLLILVLASCRSDTPGQTGTSATTTASTTAKEAREKSVAEKAGDAALRARRKAEELKAEQDAKAQETNAVMDQ